MRIADLHGSHYLSPFLRELKEKDDPLIPRIKSIYSFKTILLWTSFVFLLAIVGFSFLYITYFGCPEPHHREGFLYMGWFFSGIGIIGSYRSYSFLREAASLRHKQPWERTEYWREAGTINRVKGRNVPPMRLHIGTAVIRPGATFSVSILSAVRIASIETITARVAFSHQKEHRDKGNLNKGHVGNMYYTCSETVYDNVMTFDSKCFENDGLAGFAFDVTLPNEPTWSTDLESHSDSRDIWTLSLRIQTQGKSYSVQYLLPVFAESRP